MATWRFFQGVRSEWRWYRIARSGSVLAESERPYTTLRACMDDAARAGFDGHAYAVYTHRDWQCAPLERARLEADADSAGGDATPANEKPPTDDSRGTRGSATA